LLFPFQANTCAKGFLNQTNWLIFFTSNHWCIASNNKSTHIHHSPSLTNHSLDAPVESSTDS
jgi:hypothetical protein